MKIENLFLALGGAISAIALAAGALEVGIRLLPGSRSGMDWYMGGNHQRGLVRADPELGYSLAPGFSTRDVNAFGEFDVPVGINTLGFRDQERDPAGCANLVIGLGDSTAYGEGVPLEKTFLSLVERRLNPDGKDGFCILKAGVPGYGVHQMSRLYRRLGERYRHRMIVLGLTEYDFLRVSQGFAEFDGWLVHEAWVPFLQSCPDGSIHVRKTFLDPLHHFLTCTSRGYRWLANRRLPGEDGRSLGAVLLPDMEPGGLLDVADKSAVEHLVDMKLLANGNGVPLLVVALCFDDEWLSGFLRANGIRYFPVSCDRSWVYEQDRHLNERGHAAVADILAEQVIQGLGED